MHARPQTCPRRPRTTSTVVAPVADRRHRRAGAEPARGRRRRSHRPGRWYRLPPSTWSSSVSIGGWSPADAIRSSIASIGCSVRRSAAHQADPAVHEVAAGGLRREPAEPLGHRHVVLLAVSTLRACRVAACRWPRSPAPCPPAPPTGTGSPLRSSPPVNHRAQWKAGAGRHRDPVPLRLAPDRLLVVGVEPPAAQFDRLPEPVGRPAPRAAADAIACLHQSQPRLRPGSRSRAATRPANPPPTTTMSTSSLIP